MTSEETRDLVVASPVGVEIAADNAGTLMLAQMSEQEFQTKLAILKKGRERIAIIQRELMEPGVDYGVIPGTPKPTLLKPGAEKLCDFYHCAADFASERTVGDGTVQPIISYKTKCFLHLGALDGPIVATGEGAANSWERKHRYRSAERACPDCGALKTIIKGKDEYEKDPKFKGGWLCFGKKGGCGAKFVRDDPRIVDQQLGEVENPDPWDLDNTLLKMSEKRAYVNATLRATATSGLFTQDIEDMPEFTGGHSEQPQAAAQQPQPPAQQQTQGQPAPSQAPAQAEEAAPRGIASEDQVRAIYRILKDKKGWTTEQTDAFIKDAYGKQSASVLTKVEAAGCISTLQGNAGESAPAKP